MISEIGTISLSPSLSVSVLIKPSRSNILRVCSTISSAKSLVVLFLPKYSFHLAINQYQKGQAGSPSMLFNLLKKYKLPTNLKSFTKNYKKQIVNGV